MEATIANKYIATSTCQPSQDVTSVLSLHVHPQAGASTSLIYSFKNVLNAKFKHKLCAG